uniref:non-specific serine/threonine protein kinase n=1 Tax=Arundo donax TaxID=35708 RepID=A0A0A8XXX2_ARUDO
MESGLGAMDGGLGPMEHRMGDEVPWRRALLWRSIGLKDANLILEGEASIESSRMGLTTDLDTGTIGHAFYRYPVSFSNPTMHSFTTTFVFEITTLEGYAPQGKGSDGLAFVLSSTNKFLNDSLPGQYLGLLNMSNRGNNSKSIVAIELDTIMNPKLNDIDDNHVGIDVNSLTSVQSHTAGHLLDSADGFKFLRLADGPLQLWVEYDGKAHQLNVTLGHPWSPKPKYPLLSSLVNLPSLLPSVAYIGFSASTGKIVTRHFILGWSFKKNGESPQLNNSALPFIEQGGGNNYFPPPIPPLNFTSHQDLSPLNILLPAVIIPSLVLLVIFVVFGYVYKKRRLKKAAKQDWEINCGPPSFTYKDLVSANSGFKDEMLLGKGGFGRVYKGFLPATKHNVAIKKISPESKQGMKEFISEITILGHVRHRSLVQLLGYCRHRHELLLVYDYMPNGSFDKYLYAHDRLALGWSQRFHIIKSVASGLLYLHEEWEHVVIHRDVKSSNVLDEEMNGRLADFGLARLHDHGVDAHTTRVAGTFGYIAPELARLGKTTKATDVFTFGVFMMEVTCGRRPIEMNASGEPEVLADHVINSWQKGSIITSTDPRLEDCVTQEAEIVLNLGLLCSHPSPKVRPGMRLVMQYLESVVALPDFPLNFFSADDAANDEVYDQFVASYQLMAATITSLSGGR